MATNDGAGGLAGGLMRRLAVMDWHIGRRMRGRWAAGAYELLCFGMKQATACLFGGLMVALLLAT